MRREVAQRADPIAGDAVLRAAILATRCAGGPGAWGSMFGAMALSIDKARADRIVERANVAGAPHAG